MQKELFTTVLITLVAGLLATTAVAQIQVAMPVGGIEAIDLSGDRGQDAIEVHYALLDKFQAGTWEWKLLMVALGHIAELEAYEAKYGYIETGDKKVEDIPGCHNVGFWKDKLDRYNRVIVHDWGIEISKWQRTQMRSVAG